MSKCKFCNKSVTEFCHDCREPVREAQCAMNCGSTRPSDPTLPFFWANKYPDADGYYCGCIGWD